MRTRKLGYSDLHLTAIGLGTWAMGGSAGLIDKSFKHHTELSVAVFFE
jgi:aryl-alcohol dehydrogenase-like predicted oxidoreductase